MQQKKPTDSPFEALNFLLLFSPAIVIAAFLVDMVIQIALTKSYTPRQWLLDIVSASITGSITQIIQREYTYRLEVEHQRMVELIKAHAEEAAKIQIPGPTNASVTPGRPTEVISTSSVPVLRSDKGSN